MPVVEIKKRDKWVDRVNQICLGDGSTRVADLCSDDKDIAGVAFKFDSGNGPIGRELEPLSKDGLDTCFDFRIVATTPESLDVVINHLITAKERMMEQ